MKNNNNGSKRNKLLLVLIGAGLFVLFAYAVQVTQIDLQEPLEPKRQENLVGLLRELARPDLFAHETETRSTNISIRMPCPEDIKGSQVMAEGRTLLLAPNCATTTQDALTMSGEGFQPNVRGVIGWYPTGATRAREVADFRANGEGKFTETFTMPDIRPTEEPQRIEVVEILSRRIVGPSPIAVETFKRIIETILMALMASTIGTILAVPISFLGARNLMEGVTLPLASIMAAIVVLPIGFYLGTAVTRWLAQAALLLSSPLWMSVIAFFVVLILLVVLLRFGLPWMAESTGLVGGKIAAAVIIAALVLLSILLLAVAAQIGLVIGAWLDKNLGFLSFIGNFIYVVSDLLVVTLPLLVGFVAALIAMSYASRYAQEAIIRLATGPAKLLTFVLAGLGTFIFVFGLTYFANWICLLGLCRQLPQGQPALFLALALPALILGLLVGLFTLRAEPKRPRAIGMATYTVTRTILNTLRAIEPVIMGFVLVVWVGIGPFAGIMALMLHSIADLGKLFSEQVENIEEGPLEAVTATGANRLQMINFAVIPQIVPHYTAFIFYRWDINVRLSTIIGFVGGGGIGLILFRATNLTQYRQASVMVIAIAVVVTTLDYFSSKIRSRII